MVVKAHQRWLILSQYYPPEIGAPQIRLSALATQLVRHGINVEILTGMPNYPIGKLFPGYKGHFYLHEKINEIPIKRVWLYAANGKSSRIRLLNYISFTFTALAALLTGARPDILFVESQPLSLGFIAVLMKWLRGVPYIYNVPDLQVDAAKQLGFIRNKAFLRIAWSLETFFLKQSWKVSTVTDLFMEHFRNRGLPREQITFLPNGADTEFLKPKPPDERLLDRWRLHGKRVFVYVGTHAYYHGLDTLIEAAHLLRNHTDIVFLLIGNGPERSRIIEMADRLKLSNVIFGQSPYKEMDSLYSISYASIATLRDMEVAKSMRLSKIFPSLSCGVPVIYAGFGEAASLIQENKCGLVVAPENPGSLAQAILHLASNQKVRDEMGTAGRQFVESQYSWSAIVENWLAELQFKNEKVENKELSGPEKVSRISLTDLVRE